MTERYSDYEELRPLGEATHVPDHSLSCSGWDPRRQRSGGVDGGYPDATPTIEAECDSCGASVPTGQTKCRFCLTNHLGDETASTDGMASEATLLDVVHMVVESATFYGAVAKGGAAAKLLASNETEQAVDDCQLIYDLDETPAPQLTDQWPSLPSATRVTSDWSAQLLAAVRERTTGTATPQSRQDGEHATFLHDESGDEIHDEARLATLLEDADDVWLVPAIALKQSVEETSTESQRRESPNREHLMCRKCSQETTHRFREFEAVPDNEWTGQPVWGCQVCGTPRYGPAPEGGQ